MNSIRDAVRLRLQKHHAAPFLFLGSGFSRRYLGLQDWIGLLTQFTDGLKPIEYYLSRASGDIPQAATFLAEDYHEYWWKNENDTNKKKGYRELITDRASPLKVGISKALKALDYTRRDVATSAELDSLASTNVDGIITTNWDLLAETIFPEYKVFVGQDSLLTSHPSSIGEIYKIHGCCSKPNSLVLTAEDYASFKERQAYLAAKLLTIFVEHPVVFIGYSLHDPNVQSILRSITKGIGSSAVSRLHDNLIFLQRSSETRVAGVERGFLSVGDVQLPVLKIVAESFLEVFQPLNELKRKLPARILRFCREQLFSVVQETEPSKNLCIVDYDQLDRHTDVEFVVGVGIIGQIGSLGYTSVSKRELFSFLINGEPAIDASRIIEDTLPSLCPIKSRHFLPVYVFLRQAKINDDDASGTAPISHLLRRNEIGDFRTASYGNQLARHAQGLTTQQIVDTFPAEKAAHFIPWQREDEIDLEAVRSFLAFHFDLLIESTYATSFRKLACLYDWLKYREVEPHVALPH